jgi:hypothetical protein
VLLLSLSLLLHPMEGVSKTGTSSKQEQPTTSLPTKKEPTKKEPTKKKVPTKKEPTKKKVPTSSPLSKKEPIVTSRSTKGLTRAGTVFFTFSREGSGLVSWGIFKEATRANDRCHEDSTKTRQ